VIGVSVFLALLAVPTQGAENKFTGATLGFSVQSGPSMVNDDRLAGRAGYVVGLAGRFTGPLFLADVEVGAHTSRYSSTASGVPFDLARYSFSATVALHPLFITILPNRWVNYVLAGAHLDIGGSLEATTISAAGDRRSRGDPAWHWGGGLDFPLTDPNTGRSLWLGILYRQIRFRTDIAPSLSSDVGDHQVLLTLGYRWNWK
jgi:hypothetical protein